MAQLAAKRKKGHAKKAGKAITPEAAKARALKAWETKRAKAAAAEQAANG